MDEFLSLSGNQVRFFLKLNTVKIEIKKDFSTDLRSFSSK